MRKVVGNNQVLKITHICGFGAVAIAMHQLTT